MGFITYVTLFVGAMTIADQVIVPVVKGTIEGIRDARKDLKEDKERRKKEELQKTEEGES